MDHRAALLLLHYFGGSARSYDGLVARLGAGHRCLAPDLRGFGDNRAGGPYRVCDYAEDAARLAGGPGRFVLIGHSMGGKVAMALAARRPAGLAGLILVSPSPPCPEPMTDAARAELRASFGDRDGAARIARAISARAGPGPAFDPAVLDRIVVDHLRASRSAWDAWLDTGSREDLSGRAGQVAVPTLVVAGEEDTALGPEVQRQLTLPLLPGGARLAIVPGSRHLVPMDAPDALAGLIQRFAAGL